MNGLPYDIISLISAHLPIEDLCHVSIACRLWWKALNSPKLAQVWHGKYQKWRFEKGIRAVSPRKAEERHRAAEQRLRLEEKRSRSGREGMIVSMKLGLMDTAKDIEERLRFINDPAFTQLYLLELRRISERLL
jgi:hypothetical protein